LQKGKTITGAYYDNAPAHTSRIVTAKLEELRFEVVPHAPYSPDLAPSDFFLFPNLKKWLGGRRFTSNEEVKAETNGYFAELEESYYCEGIKKLEHRWTKCTDLEGDNVEKLKKKNPKILSSFQFHYSLWTF
jgi:histone-lysine N-methyltransferase SETMAR